MKNMRIRFGTQTLLICVALAAALAALNVLVGFAPKSLTYADLTSQKLYTLDPQTKSVLESLDKKVNVYLVAQNGNEDEGIRIMLEKYKLLSPNISVTFVDPVVNPNFVGRYSAVSLNENSLIVECPETRRTRTIDYTEIYAMLEDESLEIYSLTGEYYPDTFCLEDKLTGAINYMVTERLPEIVFLTGHGESEPDAYLSRALERDNVSLSVVNLTKEGFDLTPDLVVINAESGSWDITGTELECLREYLSGGGKILVLSDVREDGVLPERLESLCTDFGVTGTKGAIYETDASSYYRSNYSIYPSLETHKITQSLIENHLEILLLGVQPIITTEVNGVTKTVLAESSQRSFAMSDLGADPQRSDDDPDGPFPVAVLCEREDGAALLRIASTSVTLSDADSLSSGGNMSFFLNCVEWLCEKTDTISVRTSPLDNPMLNIPDYSRYVWTAVFCAVIPLGFISAGAVVWYERRKR